MALEPPPTQATSASGSLPVCARALGPGLAADHALEIAHQHRVGMGAGHGADDVEGVIDVGHPVAHGLVHGVLEGRGTGGDRHHRGAQEFHAVDIQGLALHVLGAHEHVALEAQAGGDGGAGHAVLPGAGLGDHPRLAHVLREERLADGVVHLVGAGVVQVLALEKMRAPPISSDQRRAS
jgi:hypothetical protein